MSTPKKRGTNFEYRVAYLFEEFGYEWERSGGSLGIDLKIYSRGRLTYLVSCKKTSKLAPLYISKSEIESLKFKAKEMRAKALLCFGFRRTPILAFPIDKITKLPQSRLFYKLLPEHGTALKKMLERETHRTAKAGGQ